MSTNGRSPESDGPLPPVRELKKLGNLNGMKRPDDGPRILRRWSIGSKAVHRSSDRFDFVSAVPKATYKDAGVDLEVYEESMSRLPRLMQRTFSARVLPLEGGFAGLFQLDNPARLFARRYKSPILVSGTDGVGTKLKVAGLCGRHDTVGIDLVAMCVNDIICCGAEPLFFLDYVAMAKDDPDLLEQIVRGISDGCLQADCALLGGETAIMPDVYKLGDYDLAGFAVGVVERRNLIDGKQIAAGDVVLGIASTGFHSNGYSLVRKIVFDQAKLTVDQNAAELGTTVGEALLAPTRIYAPFIADVLANYKVKGVVHGIAHITGGGLRDNIERLLADDRQVILDRSSWQKPPVFDWLQKLGDVDSEEMYRVFNMGIGMALIISPYYADSIRRTVERRGAECWPIGRVVDGPRGVSFSDDAQKS
jgi:phosphoribosylformylglycinamidine cyclo-ligase